jgi:hypothetical protein
MSSTTTPASDAATGTIASEAEAALAAADGETAESIQTLGLINQARLSLLTRTAAALTAQEGADSPQAEAATAAVNAVSVAIARIAVVGQELTTPAPEVPAGDWVVHGRVYDSESAPVPGQTVFFVNETHAYQPDIGFAYTDDTGYFVLDAARADVAEADASKQSAELYLEVANANAKPVYLSSTVFQPAVGTVTYETIQLPAGEKPIGDPPPEIRKLALPAAAERAAAQPKPKKPRAAKTTKPKPPAATPDDGPPT